MSVLPKIVIVGRPNVGKSTLFNRFVGRRAAVVSDREGVTRDRHFQEVEIENHTVELIDTGGFLLESEEGHLNDEVRNQILVAVADADLVLFVTDGRTGVVELDQALAKVVLKSAKNVLLIGNKAEHPETRQESWQLLSLGLGPAAPVSALRGYGMDGLKEEILRRLPDMEKSTGYKVRDNTPKIAILGRPNSGKSTFLNRIIGEERMVTSNVPGTTRDAIDVRISFEGTDVILTDTAGLRKKAKVNDDVEYFANMRSLESIRRSVVTILMVDAVLGMQQQDFRIAEQVRKAGKGLLIVLNKWDLVEKDHRTFDQMVKHLKEKAPFLEYVPFLSVSALSGQRVPLIMKKALEVYENCFRVLGRDRLVEVFRQAVTENPHPSRQLKKVRMDRCCQILVNPPVVAVEVSQPDLVDESWKRYLMRTLHKEFNLLGAPLRLNFDRTIRLRKDEEFDALR